MDLWRTLVRNELANLAFDGVHNQKVMTAMGPKGAAGKPPFLFQFAGPEKHSKKVFSSLDKAKEKVLEWRRSTENNC